MTDKEDQQRWIQSPFEVALGPFRSMEEAERQKEISSQGQPDADHWTIVPLTIADGEEPPWVSVQEIARIQCGKDEMAEPLKVMLKRAKETKNTVRYEEPSGGNPPIIGTLYIQKWATVRLEEPETITVTIEASTDAT